MNSLQLQLFISKSGVCSRRKAEDFIKKGRVKVNGQKVLEPFFRVDPKEDKVFIDRKQIFIKDKIYIVFHKPTGVTTTKKDPHAEKTVMDFLPPELKHLHPVGRLDKNTSGLLLLTNDGEFTLRFTHPRYNIAKVYILEVNKPLQNKDLVSLQRGVLIEGYKTAPCQIKVLSDTKAKISISEGKKRQIRKMFGQKGYKVIKLERIREAFLQLGGLLPGEYRFLSSEERKKIRNMFANDRGPQ